jgi:hypothetical protein
MIVEKLNLFSMQFWSEQGLDTFVRLTLDSGEIRELHSQNRPAETHKHFRLVAVKQRYTNGNFASEITRWVGNDIRTGDYFDLFATHGSGTLPERLGRIKKIELVSPFGELDLLSLSDKHDVVLEREDGTHMRIRVESLDTGEYLFHLEGTVESAGSQRYDIHETSRQILPTSIVKGSAVTLKTTSIGLFVLTPANIWLVPAGTSLNEYLGIA